MDSRVSSVDQIVPYLYLTGLSGITDDNIRNYGVKLIVNTASEIPRKDFNGAVTQKFDFYDSPSQDVTGYLDYVSDMIHSYVNSSQAVIVHCYMGISRSSTMVIAYLIKYNKMSYNEALNLCRSRRLIVSPNSGFVRQLQEFEKRYSYLNNSTSSYSNRTSLYSSYYDNSNYVSRTSTEYDKIYTNDNYSRVQTTPSYSAYNYSSSYLPSYYSTNYDSYKNYSKSNEYYATDYNSFNSFYNSSYYKQTPVSYSTSSY